MLDVYKVLTPICKDFKEHESRVSIYYCSSIIMLNSVMFPFNSIFEVMAENNNKKWINRCKSQNASKNNI